MRSPNYIPLKMFGGSVEPKRFIIYGVGELMSCLLFPKHLNYNQAVADNELTGLVKFVGEANFRRIYEKKDITVHRALKASNPIELEECTVDEKNLVYLKLSMLWVEKLTV